MTKHRFVLVALAAFALGASLATLASAHADPQPAIDRALMERLVRAQEGQVHALEALTRATERHASH